MAQRPGATTVTDSQQQGSESQRPISQSWHASPVSQGSLDLPGDSDGNEFVCNAGDPGSVPGSGRAPGEGKGNPLHYSCLENSMDRGAWWATVHGVSKSRTRSKLHPRGPGSTPRALRVQSPSRDPGSISRCGPQALVSDLHESIGHSSSRTPALPSVHVSVRICSLAAHTR